MIVAELIFAAAISASVGALFGRTRGRQKLGAVLSFFLGPLGWLGVLFFSDIRRRCHLCRGLVDPLAVICPHCRGELIAGSSKPGKPTLPDHEYYYWFNESAKGPLPKSKIMAMVTDGTLPDDCLVSDRGEKDWYPLSEAE